MNIHTAKHPRSALNSAQTTLDKFKLHDLSQRGDSISCLTSQPPLPVIQSLSSAHVLAFTTQPLFGKDDKDHKSLFKFAKQVFKSDHLYLEKYPPQNDTSSEKIQHSQVVTLPYNSSKIPADLKANNVLIVPSSRYSFDFLEFAWQALITAREMLAKEEQEKLSDWSQLSRQHLYISLHKGSVRGKKTHVDKEMEAIFSISIPSLTKKSKPDAVTQIKTAAEKQSTLYKTKDDTFEHVPLGCGMVMFPNIHPLEHNAPPLSNAKEKRWFLGVGILMPAKLEKYKKRLQRFGIEA